MDVPRTHRTLPSYFCDLAAMLCIAAAGPAAPGISRSPIPALRVTHRISDAAPSDELGDNPFSDRASRAPGIPARRESECGSLPSLLSLHDPDANRARREDKQRLDCAARPLPCQTVLRGGAPSSARGPCITSGSGRLLLSRLMPGAAGTPNRLLHRRVCAANVEDVMVGTPCPRLVPALSVYSRRASCSAQAHWPRIG
jgi:hypothetical protein